MTTQEFEQLRKRVDSLKSECDKRRFQYEAARSSLVELGVDPEHVDEVIKGLEDKIESEATILNDYVKDLLANITAMEKELSQ